jgi:hypothetical protein
MNITPRSESVNDVLRQSMRGIQKEINIRTLKICGLKERVTGNEKRFVKPYRNQLPTIYEALKLQREVEKLRVIKNQLRELL